uniref:Secreted protein n=1 Tax=Anguilla anguilla TaxID=7936 RepID=A0A0E9S7S6_ANGAN
MVFFPLACGLLPSAVFICCAATNDCVCIHHFSVSTDRHLYCPEKNPLIFSDACA